MGREGLRPLDVVRLRAFVAATKQKDQQLSALDVIDPVSGPKSIFISTTPEPTLLVLPGFPSSSR